MDPLDDVVASGLLAAAAAQLIETEELREAALVLARAAVEIGAEGAEVWCEGHDGWRRLAGAGQAVLDHVVSPTLALIPTRDTTYPGTLLLCRGAGITVAARTGHPGSDAREQLEESLEALLTVLQALEFETDEGNPGIPGIGGDWPDAA